MFQLVKSLLNSNKFFKKSLSSCCCGRYYSTAPLSENDVEEVRIPVPWGHIAGKWWGKKDGTPILGVHDWQQNASSFDRLLPLLNTSNFLAVDLPGHGHSSPFPKWKFYTFSEFLFTIRRIIMYLQWEKYSLFGHSFGSALSFFYSSIYKEEIDYFISLECARALLLIYTVDIPQNVRKGIDQFLKYEKEIKKDTAQNSELSDTGIQSIKDLRIDMKHFGVFNEEMIMEFAKHITSPVLSIEGKNNYANSDMRAVYDKSNEILRGNSKYFEHHKIDGSHALLDTPESVSPIINKFLDGLKGKYWGPRKKRPFLLIHGWQDNASSFDRLIPLLPNDRGYLAIDLPGHGFSSHYPQGAFYSFEDSMTNIRRIQSYFSWEKVSLIGHSLGAIVSLTYSAVFNDDVDVLVCMDAAKSYSIVPGTCHSKAKERIDKFLDYDSRDGKNVKLYEEVDIIKKMKEALRTEDEDICKIIMRRGLKESNGLFSPVRDPRIKSLPPFGFTHSDNIQFAKRIKCNVLVIKSEDTSYYEPKKIFYDFLDNVKKNSKYFEYVKVSGIHHFHLEKPQLVASIVENFLKRIQ